MSTTVDTDERSLRSLLLGPPLSARGADPANTATLVALDAALTRHLLGVIALLDSILGTSAAANHARADLVRVARMPPSATGITCKRGALLFAVHSEPEFHAYFADAARDAVPAAARLLTPVFERHLCQNPEAYVLACAVFAEMWQGETLGCWPIRPGEPHRCDPATSSSNACAPARTTILPDGSCSTLDTANADAPPPAGSIAHST